MKWTIFLLTVLTSITLAQSPSPSPSPGPKKIRVLEIDTGVDSAHFDIMYHLDKADVEKNLNDYLDHHGHGTHIAGLIVKDTCADVVLYSCKYYDPYHLINLKTENQCFKLAESMNLDMLVYAGGGTDPNDDEKASMEILDKQGVVMVVAAGNEHSDLHKAPYYPASYTFDNIIAVGNLYVDEKEQRRIARSSNYNMRGMAFQTGTGVLSSLPGNNKGLMTGTSQATAVMANKLLKFWCKKK